MKYLVPTPKIDLYSDGFNQHDILNRAEKGRQLSELLDRIDDPIVVAVDGGWGSGKSFFLKCWVGAHINEFNKSANIIYFDAYANDYLDDPLISLILAVDVRLGSQKNESNGLRKVKAAATKLAKPVTRIGLAMLTYGVSELTGAATDVLIGATSKEINGSIDQFWAAEAGRQAAIQQFKEGLELITTGEGGEPKKLVVVIDELDRCRPDFALSILETIKHFFSLPNIHFVLGINSKELANSVRARYGAAFDAELYLQKFVTASLSLPNDVGERGRKQSSSLIYFQRMADLMSIDSVLVDQALYFLKRREFSRNISLRDMDRFLSVLAFIPQNRSNFSGKISEVQILIAGLAVLKAFNPDTYKKAREGSISMEDIRSAFKITLPLNSDVDHEARVIHHFFATYINPEERDPDKNWGRSNYDFGSGHGKDVMKDYLNDYLETISFNPT